METKDKLLKSSSKKISKIIRGIANAMFWIVLGVFLFVSVFAIINKERTGIPSVFGIFVPLIASSSMSAADLNEGDYIVIKKCDPDELQVGDIIAFYSHSTPGASKPSEITAKNVPDDIATLKGKNIYFHEIVAIHPQTDATGHRWFYTKGASNNNVDSTIVYDGYVVGKYQKLSKKTQNLLNFFMQPVGRVLIIAVPAGIIMVFDVYQIIIIFIEIKKEKFTKLM